MIHGDGKDCLKERRLGDDEKLFEDIVEKHPDLRHYHARTKKKPLRFSCVMLSCIIGSGGAK